MTLSITQILWWGTPVEHGPLRAFAQHFLEWDGPRQEEYERAGGVKLVVVPDFDEQNRYGLAAFSRYYRSGQFSDQLSLAEPSRGSALRVYRLELGWELPFGSLGWYQAAMYL